MNTTPIFTKPINNNSSSKGLVLPLSDDTQKQKMQEMWGENIQTYSPDEARAMGPLGRRIWMDITLGESTGQSGQWSYVKNNTKENIPVLHIPCCLVDISTSKEIVKSAPMGGSRTGTIKEHINMGDYQISIKGILTDDDNAYPLTKVKTLNLYLKAPVQIPISHDLLNDLGIYEIVIESVKLPTRQGFETIQAFDITCVSDYPVELEIKNKAELTK